MKYRTLSMAWATWREAVAVASQQAAMVKRAVQKMRNASLTASFTKWHDTWSIAVLQGATLASAARKLLRRQLYRSFVSWRAMAEVLRSQVKVLKGCLAKMQHRKLHMAWARWWEEVDAAKERLTLDQVALRFLNKKLFAALNKWRDASWVGHSKEGQVMRRSLCCPLLVCVHVLLRGKSRDLTVLEPSLNLTVLEPSCLEGSTGFGGACHFFNGKQAYGKGFHHMARACLF